MTDFLTPRLKTIADVVPKCKTVADVGTDHAYLPIYLISNNKCEKCIASDIAQGPLSRAEEYIKRHLGDTNRIKTVLSDGLKNIDEPCDIIVIAGMGGETVYGILSAADIKTGQKFILQPMSKFPELREYLYRNGYVITDEIPVREEERVYSVILTEKTSEKVDYEPVDIYVSPSLREKTGADRDSYIEKVIRRLEKKYSGLKKAVNPQIDEIEKYRIIIDEIKKIGGK